MFKRVLIAEDQQSANISVRKMVEDMGITGAKYVYHCDDALLQLKNALLEDDPFELLITDLLFEPDDRPQKLPGGEALITASKQLQPGLKILVFSAEQRGAVIASLFNTSKINGYVRKARRDAEELQGAISSIYKNKLHHPSNIEHPILKNIHEFSPYDVAVIRLIAEGKSQKEISAYLDAHHIRPSSLSSLEKRLNLIRESYDFTNNGQLIAFCKDLGVI
ncbi:MAG: Transcriptional regulator [Mucilaginibacter sp.]|nr:Transcriptional regulator [Mucilaginibacter sp.]